jgi:hypothetical protein
VNVLSAFFFFYKNKSYLDKLKLYFNIFTFQLSFFFFLKKKSKFDKLK